MLPKRQTQTLEAGDDHLETTALGKHGSDKPFEKLQSLHASKLYPKHSKSSQAPPLTKNAKSHLPRAYTIVLGAYLCSKKHPLGNLQPKSTRIGEVQKKTARRFVSPQRYLVFLLTEISVCVYKKYARFVASKSRYI